MGVIALAVLAYLIGSISFAVLVSRACGLPDPRSYGSGNPGATNVLRSGKKIAALLTLSGDAAKGWIAVALAQILAPIWGVAESGVALAGLSVFLGHIYPIFFKFKGGKGVATAAGILLGLDAVLGLLTIGAWLLVFALSRISSLSALAAAIAAPIYAAFFLPPLITGLVIVLSLLLIWRHRANIHKLLQGEESGFKKARE